MFKCFGAGTIIHARVASYKESTWLEVTLAVEDSKGESIRVLMNNRNGLLEDFRKDASLVLNRWVSFSGSLIHSSVMNSYTKPGQKMVRKLKHPRLRLNYGFIKRIPLSSVTAGNENDLITPQDIQTGVAHEVIPESEIVEDVFAVQAS